MEPFDAVNLPFIYCFTFAVEPIACFSPICPSSVCPSGNHTKSPSPAALNPNTAPQGTSVTNFGNPKKLTNRWVPTKNGWNRMDNRMRL